LQNTTSIRRKAQQLAQKGAVNDAMAEYAKLAEQGHLEPYDLVVYGDLLTRAGNRDDAVARYLEAMDSYAKAGLHRNAIALGKKVRRLAPAHTAVPRKLGELYAAEGLASESCLHFLEYLETLNGKEPGAADTVEEVGKTLLGLSLPSFQVVKQIVAAAKPYGRDKALAAGVLHQAQRARDMKNAEAEKSLLVLARSLDPHVESQGGAAAPRESESPQPFIDPGQVDLAPAFAPAAAAAPLPPAAPPVLSLDDFSFDEPASAVASPNGAGPAEAEPAEVEVEAGSDAEDSLAAIEDADALRAQALGYLERNDSSRALRAFIKAATAYFDGGRTKESAELFERVVRIDPNHLEALRGLVEIAHINGEKGKMAHWGCELGDVLLAREMYAEAKIQFERVLAFDGRNAKAQARLKRLNAIAGVQSVGFGPLAPAPSEVRKAQVTVRDDNPESTQSQSSLNLSQILEEFRAAVVERIPATDGQSHYDLGMTYMEMGLLEEALREFETAATAEENRLTSMEMMGECYLLLSRFEEAIRSFESVAALADQPSRARAHLKLGQIYEEMAEWSRAEEEYYRALELDEGLEEAVERLGTLEERRERGAA
jgi:tetratricopeptide (TPR) repeat protein